MPRAGACRYQKACPGRFIEVLAAERGGYGPIRSFANVALEATRTTLARVYFNHSSMRIQPGTRLGPYEVERLLGAGGMGEVYLAHDTRLRRDVAVKVLRSAVRESNHVARPLGSTVVGSVEVEWCSTNVPTSTDSRDSCTMG